MLTLILLVITLLAGFALGRKYPTALAAAQAMAHKASAESLALETKIRAKNFGIDLHPDTEAAAVSGTVL